MFSLLYSIYVWKLLGFGMFNSFMAVENLLQNPVAQVFVMLMQSNIRLSSENFDFAMKMFSEGKLINPLS